MAGNTKGWKNFSDEIGRREFIGGVAATAGVMFIPAARVWGSEANSPVRVGLLGCGGRGTEDATNLVDTGGARIGALADMFQDQLDTAHAAVDKMQAAKGYAAIDASQLCVGPKAYEKIAHSKEVCAMVIATPPRTARTGSVAPIEWPRMATSRSPLAR